MKIAIITDQHFGVRKNSKLFHDYFLKFYEDVFFPTLEKEGIDTIVDMGDTFDSRKGIDFSALQWSKLNYFDRLREMGCKVHTIVGNHTAYYKNTNEVNAIDLLLREYDNVKVYAEPTEIKLDKLGILLVPWICQENEKRTFKKLENTKCDVVMGHLELNGFTATLQVIKWSTALRLLSLKDLNVSILDIFISDPIKDPYIIWEILIKYIGMIGILQEGFHLFDTDTLEHTPVNNPYDIFYKIFYDDTPYQTFDTREYENKIVKVIVRKKSDIKQFEKFIDKLYNSNVAEVKIVENFDFGGWYFKDDDEAFESEDTMSILNRYIEEAEITLDKSKVSKILQDVYQEACETV